MDEELKKIVERIRAVRATLRDLESEHLRLVTAQYGEGDGLAQIGFHGDE